MRRTGSSSKRVQAAAVLGDDRCDQLPAAVDAMARRTRREHLPDTPDPDPAHEAEHQRLRQEAEALQAERDRVAGQCSTAPGRAAPAQTAKATAASTRRRVSARRGCLGCRGLSDELARLRRELERAKKRMRRLETELESVRRAAKRQAAPFSKGRLKGRPRRPGRKPGPDYGTPARRPVPPQVDDILDAPLPERCPDCHGALEETGVLEQHQTEIPEPRPIIRRIDIHQGRCRVCGRTVRGRYPEQTSQATGAAASQFGPRALAMMAMLNKGLGLSFEKTARVMRDAFGIEVSRAGAWHAVFRTARAGEPTYQALTEQVQRAPVVSVDETGWKVEAVLRWLWVFATPRIVVYRIAAGRGFEQAAAVLGTDYSGVIVRDG